MSGFKSALVVSTAAVLGATAFSQTASAAEVTLRMANWAGTAHHMYHYTLPKWYAEVSKQTDGKLEIIYDKVMLSKSAGLYDLARDGVRDITWSSGSQNPGRFELFRFAEVPFGAPETVKGSVLFNEWYNKKHKLNEREMSDVKFLFAWHHGPGLLHTKKPVHTAADVQGLKVRAQSGDVEIAKAVGMIPVTLGATQAYEGLQRGTIDATFFPMEAIHSFRLVKLVKYHVQAPKGAMYVGSFYVTMNPKSYDGLPADIRDGLMRAADKGAEIVGGGWAEFDKRAESEAKAAGNEIITLSEAEAARWKKAVEDAGAVEEIIKRGETAGHKDSRELMSDLLQMWGAAGS
jgi:TRAP-type C4-dicarboxylate transport system substrate-binding protein